jgi:hypothetical protein
MGQYYVVVFLADKKIQKEIIRAWVCSHTYMQGSKLTEHCFINNPMMFAVEQLLCPRGMFYMSRIVWAGDYATNEENSNKNLYTLSNENEDLLIGVKPVDTSCYKYIVNHTKCLYVDKTHSKNNIHPLPLLVAEGNGQGGGDYYGKNKNMCGTWARDTISMEEVYPDGFTELICEFEE